MTMAQMMIVAFRSTVGTYSFSSGFAPAPVPKPSTEEEILRHALYLERHGREDEALAYLERRCPKK
jgi:hypothetical protein